MSQGSSKGWTQTFQLCERRGREKVSVARRENEVSKAASIIRMWRKDFFISSEGDRRIDAVNMLPQRPKMVTNGIRNASM